MALPLQPKKIKKNLRSENTFCTQNHSHLYKMVCYITPESNQFCLNCFLHLATVTDLVTKTIYLVSQNPRMCMVSFRKIFSLLWWRGAGSYRSLPDRFLTTLTNRFYVKQGSRNFCSLQLTSPRQNHPRSHQKKMAAFIYFSHFVCPFFFCCLQAVTNTWLLIICPFTIPF